MSERVVLFPIEGASRELDYRVLLATLIADDDTTVILGQQDVIYRLSQVVSGGVYVGQNFITSEGGVHNNMTRHANLKRRGFSIVHLDEEGGVLAGRGPKDWSTSLLRRYDARKLAADDVMCVWGGLQRDTYAALSPSCRLVVTGHPRFDVQKPQFRDYFSGRVAAIKDRVGGPFILINTSFPRANHHQGVQTVFSGREHYFVDDPAARLRAVGLWAVQSRGLTAFVQMVHEAAVQLKSYRFVVRHHPSESADFYKAVFTGVDNVLAIHEDAVAPWILAADGVVFDSCTTGLEAWAFGAPTLAFRLPRPVEHDFGLPNAFGRLCTTGEEVIAAMAALSSTPRARHEVGEAQLRDLRSLIDNIDDGGRSAFDAVSDVIRGRVSSATAPRASWRADLRSWERRRALLAKAKGWARELTPARQRSYLSHRAKFQGFHATGIAERLAAARRVWKRDVKAEILSDDVVVIGGRYSH